MFFLKHSWIREIHYITFLRSQNLQALGTFRLMLPLKRLTYQLWKQVILDHCLVWPVTKGKRHGLSWLSPRSTTGISHSPSESVSTDYFTYWAIYLLTMSWGSGKKFNYILEQSVFSSMMIASSIKDDLNFITACGKCFLCAPYHEALLSTRCCGIHKLFFSTIYCN